MYMDLSFTIKNPINAGGTVVITYTNVQMFTTNWKLDADAAANGNTGYCFLKYMGSTITCTPVSG